MKFLGGSNAVPGTCFAALRWRYGFGGRDCLPSHKPTVIRIDIMGLFTKDIKTQ
jgi:hypothetical protein